MSQERSTVEVLKAARERISDPERWCQGQGRSGDRVCASTAYEEAARSPEERDEARKALRIATREFGWHSVPMLNDLTDHTEVLRMYDRAIELAEATK